ncbi:hypothetical protein LTR62_000364 [Meristemomyces frigidus]|uniref:Myb-like DNA-binding domain-containing protein n=1 Tax=Meristemomyces frigidus TaxID=1508187 RepID=A0AAN7YM17_9PEZI|nr:hypothetical protein LTR62_000364 [Meristemomyces frigidus]
MAKEAAAPAVTEEQFFMAIIEQLDGKVDWKKVAEKCDIVSAGAANKRFSRLKVKYGVSDSASPKKTAAPAAEEGETMPSKKATPRKAANKKRKVEETVEED